MVILIDECLLKGDGFSSGEIGNLANLALSSLDGQHLIVCGRNVARQLSSDPRLGERERAFFKRSIDEYTSLGGMISACLTYVKVIREGARAKVIHEDGSCHFEIPLAEFSSLRTLTATKLLCENLGDCRWLKAATVAFMKQTVLRRTKLNLDFVAGGGDTTSEIFREIVSQPNGLVICIVDSDKKPRDWRIGETAKKCIHVAHESDPTRFLFILLPCHELENLTPDELLDDPRRRIRLSCNDTGVKIANLSRLGLIDARLHIDIKNGLRLGDIWDSWSNQAFKKQWKPFVEAVENGDMGLSEQCQTCASATKCCIAGSCVCTIFSPLGGGILQSVEAWWRQSGTDLWRGLPSFLSDILNAVCGEIASYGCAASRYSV